MSQGFVPAPETKLKAALLVKTDFNITHHWQLQARPEELAEIVLDTTAYEAWCARILLKCEVLEEGGPDGLGLHLRFHTKGWLPHSFLFNAKVIETVDCQSMVIAVTGDFEGHGYIEVTGQEAETCFLKLNWVIDVHHPVLRRFVRFFHPILTFNHIWAVRQVRWMMQNEIKRRRAHKVDFATPAPTFGRYLGLMRHLHGKRAAQMGWRTGFARLSEKSK